jgi:hypothetical protein
MSSCASSRVCFLLLALCLAGCDSEGLLDDDASSAAECEDLVVPPVRNSGGAFFANARVAERNGLGPGYRHKDLGFRLSRTIP